LFHNTVLEFKLRVSAGKDSPNPFRW
jgi:hypothetical protein